MGKYKWNNLFWSTDGACWNLGLDFARGGEPIGEKVIIHCKYALDKEYVCFDCDIEFEVIKYSNETMRDYELDGFRNTPFLFYLARVNLDKTNYKDPRGDNLYGLLIAEDEITMRKFCKENKVIYTDWKNKSHYGEVVEE